MKLVHWPLMGGLLQYIWHSEEGTGRGHSPPRPLLAVPNITARPTTASVPITVLLYNGPLLCGFNVPIKGFNLTSVECDDSVKVSDEVTGKHDDRQQEIENIYIKRSQTQGSGL